MATRNRFVLPLVRMVGLVTALVGGLILTTVTVAASNPGDIWLNNVGSAAVQGHVPHLQSKDIAMYAKYPGGGGGTFRIVAWKPTGDNKTVVYSGTWTYDPKGADVQQIATVSIKTLDANLQKLGITPQKQQGFHFKMYCSIGNHEKMKEFWVAAPTAPPAPITTPSPTATGAVAGVSGSNIGLAETGGPLLGIGLLALLLGGLALLGSTAVRRRS